MIGGYQIIDFKNKDLVDGVGMVFEGVYELIEGTRKPILLTNITFEGKEYRNTFVNFNVQGSSFVGTFDEGNGLTANITVQDNDVVTIQEN